MGSKTKARGVDQSRAKPWERRRLAGEVTTAPPTRRREASAPRADSHAPFDSNLAVARFDILRLGGRGRAERAVDYLTCEEPLEVRVRGCSVAVTMRTPGHDAELAAGFLLSEGLVRDRADIVEIAPCLTADSPANVANVFLAPRVVFDPTRLTRHVFASSSCGICGKASIEAVHQHFPPLESNVSVSTSVLARLPERMRAAQASFALTGGLHAAALFTRRGRLLVLREDVGRHNAVDKVLGWNLLQGRSEAQIVLVSGRASFEIVQKALAARIPIVAAVSAPSGLAVEFARESGQTLIGFLRAPRMNIYGGEQRVSGAGQNEKSQNHRERFTICKRGERE